MDAWLRCVVSAGQFDGEASVRLTDFAGDELSLFVPLRDVRYVGNSLGDTWVDGHLAVDVLDSQDDLCLIYLPGPTFNNGQAITVRRDQLDLIGSGSAV